jgi:hypothetical protein
MYDLMRRLETLRAEERVAPAEAEDTPWDPVAQ